MQISLIFIRLKLFGVKQSTDRTLKFKNNQITVPST